MAARLRQLVRVSICPDAYCERWDSFGGGLFHGSLVLAVAREPEVRIEWEDVIRGSIRVAPSIQQQQSANRTLRIVCPNGHLGFAPLKTGSFQIGLAAEPDLICADTGSCDV